MEPDDLSFLEISGEDDSLLPLQHIANDDVSSLNKAYFACSPLQIPRSACSVNPTLVSPIVDLTGNKDVGKLDLLSHSVNKENVSSNKPELPKLNMEPQQMKRKKKGGGYNLRKSLAWNKAFFTEEGFLDPLELSTITGNSGNSIGEMMSVIEEDEREYLAGNSKDLTALGENVYEELPAKNVREDRKISGALLLKNGSPARVKEATASVVSGSPAGVRAVSAAGKRKVLSAHDVNRSESKRSGIPRPVASSSLKRPANVNTTNSTTKESKFSRVPARKLDTSVRPATAKINIPGASNTKRNQISQSVASVQRNVGSKVASNSTKSARSDAKSGSTGRSTAVKSSVQQAKRNVTNSAIENHSLAKAQYTYVSKTKNALTIGTAPPVPTCANVSNNHGGDSRKVPISLPSDGSMPRAPIQTAKPSGLRMPSPSLGFFNQSKASASHSLLPRSNKACNVPESNILNSTKFGALNTIQERPIPAPVKMLDMANGVAATGTKIPKSIKGSSIPTGLSSDEIQKVELDVPSNSCNIDVVSNQQKLHSQCNGIDQEAMPIPRPSENEKISHVVNNESKSDDNKLLLHRTLIDQLKNDDDDDKKVANIYPMSMDLIGTELENPQFSSLEVEGAFDTKNMVDNQHVATRTCDSLIKNHAATSELHDILKRQNDWLGFVHHVNEQPRKQDEEMTPCIDQVSTEFQKPCMNNGALSKVIRSSEFHTCKTAKIADGSPEVRLCIGGVAESSHCQPHSADTVEAKDSVTGIENICTKSLVGDVDIQSVDGILSAGSSGVVLCPSASDKMVVDDMSENVIDANGSELTCSGAQWTIPSAIQDCGFNMSETAECPHGHDTISGITDAQPSHEIKFRGIITGDSEIIGKDQSINVATTTDVKFSNVCSDSGDCSGCELDLQHFETQPNVPVQTENCARVNDIIAAMKVQSGYVMDNGNEQKDVENNLNSYCSNSDGQPADDISYSQHNTSMVCTDLLSDMDMAYRQSVEGNQNPKASDKLLSEDDSSNCQHSTSMAHNDRLSSMHMFCGQSVEGIQVTKLSDEVFSENGMPFEESGDSYMGQVTDINLDVKIHSGRVPESSHDPFQQKHTEQENEEIASFDNKIKKSLVQNVQMQVLEGSLLADSCRSKFNAPVVDEIHISDLVTAQGSLDAHGSCLNDKLIVNNVSSEENQDINVCGNLVDDVLEQFDACANESNSSIVCTQVAAAVREGGIDEDQKTEEDEDVQNIGVDVLKSDVLPEEASISQNNDFSNCEINHELENFVFATEDVTMSSSGGVFQDREGNVLTTGVLPEEVLKSDVLPEEASISQNNGFSNSEINHELENFVFATEDATMSSSGGVFQDREANVLTSGVLPEEVLKSDVLPEEASISQNNGFSNCEINHELENFVCATEDATMSSSGGVFQDIEANVLTSGVLPEEVDIGISQMNSDPNCEMQSELEDAICHTEDQDATECLKKSGSDKKQDNLVIKPPPHAVPFSEEWLAAFEAAGEEILTIKSGAVQHSPPDKPLPEPNPWSPVKRKNNQGIGPFDCTKFTNGNISTPPSNSTQGD